MKVLLVNPPIENIIGLELPLWVRQNEGIFPPLGLMYIASYLKKNIDCEVKILDVIAEKMDYKGIEQYIQNFHPDVAGITTHTHNLIDAILVTKIIKKIDKNIHVCLGGAHVNVFPQETIGISSVDSVILQEGELTFKELVDCLSKNVNLEKVKGLIFKQNGKVVNTGLREVIKDLNSLPFPQRSLLNPKKYYSILGRKSIMTTIISSRGCPYQCSFCSSPKLNYRVRSPENIGEEIEESVELGIEEVHFVDDTFNVYPERVIKICDEIKKRKLKINWSFCGRVDKLTTTLLKKVKESGCYRIHLGVEASTNEGLTRLKKGITVAQVRQAFKWANGVGVNTVAYFLIGCPHEREKKDIIRTINFSKEINPDFALFNILTPYPSTELYEEGFKRGVVKKDYWREFALNPKKDFQPQFWQEWFSKEELVYLLYLAYRKFYLRPRFILKTLSTPLDLKIFLKRLKTGIAAHRLIFKKN